MRIYKDEIRLTEVICNCCGKSLKVEDEILKEGCFHVDYIFDYFSERDGERDIFDMCESCYEKMVKDFKIPVTTAEVTEYL